MTRIHQAALCFRGASMRRFRRASTPLPTASALPLQPVRIPRLLLPLLAVVVGAALPVAAAVNVEALYLLGEKLYGSKLAWTLPAVVVGYEFVSTGVYFMTPKLLPGLRRSAFVGALLGFLGTVVLSILYTAMYGSGDVGLKILMKPVPSFIAIAFAHMLVLVWHAKLEAKEINSIVEAAPIPTPEELEADIARRIDEAVAPVRRELASARRALRKQEATAVVLPPAPVLPPQPVQEALPADPPVKQEAPNRKQEVRRVRSLPRVGESHKRIAMRVLAEAEAAGRDPLRVLPSAAKDAFPEGVSTKTVGNALIVARTLWKEGVRPTELADSVSV